MTAPWQEWIQKHQPDSQVLTIDDGLKGIYQLLENASPDVSDLLVGVLSDLSTPYLLRAETYRFIQLFGHQQIQRRAELGQCIEGELKLWGEPESSAPWASMCAAFFADDFPPLYGAMEEAMVTDEELRWNLLEPFKLDIPELSVQQRALLIRVQQKVPDQALRQSIQQVLEQNGSRPSA